MVSLCKTRWHLLRTGSSPLLTKAIHPRNVRYVNPVVKRIHGWSWQAFPVGMGTGAVYVVLSDVKSESPVLKTVVTVFYFINIALFLINTITLLLQAIMYPRHALEQLQDPAKSVFVPLIVLSLATIIIGTARYAIVAGHPTPEFIYALFWVYVAAAILTSVPMLIVWYSQPHDLTHFTPASAFIIFPLMLIGVVSANVLKVMDPEDGHRVGVLLVGYFFQGLGFFTTLFYICIYVIRLMMTGIPEGQQANGAFICCGPPGFTALALIKLGSFSRDILKQEQLISPIAGEVWYSASVLSGILLLGFAVFFFIFGALPYWSKIHKNLHEILGCWALTFPNVGWISTINALGDVLEIQGLITLHLILSIGLCVLWVVLFVLTVVAVLEGDIFTSTDEDVMNDSIPQTRSMNSTATQTSEKIEV